MHVLASIYSQIEMVEPVVKFLDDAREEPALATKVAAGEIVQTAVGLQDWTGLPQASYDLVVALLTLLLYERLRRQTRYGSSGPPLKSKTMILLHFCRGPSRDCRRMGGLE